MGEIILLFYITEGDYTLQPIICFRKNWKKRAERLPV